VKTWAEEVARDRALAGLSNSVGKMADEFRKKVALEIILIVKGDRFLSSR